MTTLNYDAYIPLDDGEKLYTAAEIDGYLSTDYGTSNPYFHVNYVRLEGGRWYRPVAKPLTLRERIIAAVAKLAEVEPDLIKAAAEDAEMENA